MKKISFYQMLGHKKTLTMEGLYFNNKNLIPNYHRRQKIHHHLHHNHRRPHSCS
jgi:N-methylhydantoinase B/oxoprolinase/acetone carboxylase alpha subunit